MLHAQALHRSNELFGWSVSQKTFLTTVDVIEPDCHLMTTQKGSHLTFRNRRLCIINQNMTVDF